MRSENLPCARSFLGACFPHIVQPNDFNGIGYPFLKIYLPALHYAIPPAPFPPMDFTLFLGHRYPPIRNTLVPHTGQTPLVAGLPFFMVILVGFLISTLALHFTQYACITPYLLLRPLPCLSRGALPRLVPLQPPSPLPVLGPCPLGPVPSLFGMIKNPSTSFLWFFAWGFHVTL